MDRNNLFAPNPYASPVGPNPTGPNDPAGPAAPADPSLPPPAGYGTAAPTPTPIAVSEPPVQPGMTMEAGVYQPQPRFEGADSFNRTYQPPRDLSQRFTPPPKPPSRHYGIFAAMVAVAAVIALSLSWLGYSAGAGTANTARQAVAARQKQVSAYNAQIKLVDDQNHGLAPASTVTDPVGKLSLASGRVTFDMPVDWLRGTTPDVVSQCNGGTLDSGVTCVDIATALPKSLNVSQPEPRYHGLDISVFQRTDNSEAKDWYTKYYNNGTVLTDPQPIQLSDEPINTYSTYSFQTWSLPVAASKTIIKYYVFVHNNYAVVLSATMRDQINGKKVDYSAYGPAIDAIARSIRFYN